MKNYCYVVNPKSKISLGKFPSFSSAKKYQILNGLLNETQIWGFDPRELKSTKNR